MRNGLAFLTCLHTLLLLATIFTFFSMLHESYAQVINVPEDYPTIGEAIEAASDGDTIQVSRRSGESQSVYYERLSINKEVMLVGEDRETIIVDGNAAGTVIRVQADNVEFRGFTVRNGGSQYSGIRVNSYSYVTIADNTIETSKYGVVFVNSHYNTVVQNQLFNNSAADISLSQCVGSNVNNNDVSDSAYGIKLYSTNATFVVGNTVADNSYGIFIEYSSNDTVDNNILLRNSVNGILPNVCEDIIVSNNEVSKSAYGIELYNSDTITILDNEVIDNSYGIYLAFSGPSNTIENNTISLNDWGIQLYNSSSSTFRGNILSNNTFGADLSTESNNNLWYHNNFLENVEQAVWNPECVNAWDDGYPSGGNYWSDYTGTDSNGDGIGDTAYIIDPVNRDRYPLMIPWGVIHDVAVINVTSSTNRVYAGQIVNITVVARNEGTETESFTVTTTYENTTLGITGTIGTQVISNLSPSANSTLKFEWNTTNMQPCVNYTMKAEASVVFGETETGNNVCVGGAVKVKIIGDANGDGTVNLDDLMLIARALGTDPRYPPGTGWDQWNPDCDMNNDQKVDSYDLYVTGRSYGTSC